MLESEQSVILASETMIGTAMSKSADLLSCVTFAVAALVFPPLASAQTSQWCPPAGTVIKGKNNRGEWTTTTKGADPTDSAVCTSVAVGPGVAGSDHGKLMRRLYDYYDLTNYTLSPETMKSARDGLGAILAGQTQEISYARTISAAGGFGWYYSGGASGVQTWKRLGETTLSIGGHPTKVIMLRASLKGGANSGYDGYTDLWYDPASHIFVKFEEHQVGGPVRFASEVISVTPP